MLHSTQRPSSRVIALGLVALTCSCKKSGDGANIEPARSPEAALAGLREAARERNAQTLWHLLDQQTRWSVMSTRRARRRLRRLIEEHYPPQRRAAELRRTELAGKSANAKAYFVQLIASEQQKLFTPLAALATTDKQPDRPGCVRFGPEAPQAQRFCQGKDGHWYYSGLREHFEQLKLRATRDLETVKEGVSMQGGG
jgi:hypothetical protein